MNTDRRRSMIDALSDKEYRDLWVESHITEGLALQIRALRENRGWTQSQLGEQADFKQEAISRLEDPDYGKYSLSTLRRLASAFDVALVVRFATFSELVDWTVNLTPGRLSPQSFAQDTLLADLSTSVLTVQGGVTLVGLQYSTAIASIGIDWPIGYGIHVHQAEQNFGPVDEANTQKFALAAAA